MPNKKAIGKIAYRSHMLIHTIHKVAIMYRKSIH